MDTPDPFASPRADTEVAPEAPVGTQILAERGTRLGAAMIDGFAAMLALIPAMIGGFERITSGSPLWFVGREPLSIAGTMLWVGLMIFQGYLIATTGQSIGKKLLGIRIVRLDGTLPGLVHGYLIRMWAIALIGYIPVVGASLGGIVSLVDALMIFGDERRCLHDRLAGTKVVLA